MMLYYGIPVTVFAPAYECLRYMAHRWVLSGAAARVWDRSNGSTSRAHTHERPRPLTKPGFDAILRRGLEQAFAQVAIRVGHPWGNGKET